MPGGARSRTAWGTRYRVREWIAHSWLVIPGLYTAGAVALGVATADLHDAIGSPLGLHLADGTADGILQTIASGMISFTGIVVSVAVVVVQFGAGTYTPRLVLRFRRDPVVKHALGFFIAPAIYALVALTDVATAEGPVADLAVTIALVLLVAAVFAFFLLVGRLLDLLRPRRLYRQLRIYGERAIDDVYPRDFGAARELRADTLPDVQATLEHRGADGVVVAIDLAAMRHAASGSGSVIEIVPRIGEYLWRGEPVLRVRGGALHASAERAARRALIVAEERTITQDPAFAVRTIVDIAIRALSPAVNDPTTAAQSLDVLDVLLRRLANRDLGTGYDVDAHGQVRLVYPAADWTELLDLALTEIRIYGAGSPQIPRRMRAVLEGLAATAPEARRPAVENQLALLEEAVDREVPAGGERALAKVADHTGLGGRSRRASGA